jgi:hypothetical protein
LERLGARVVGSHRLVVQFGRVTKRLSADFTDPRYLVAVKQRPEGPGGQPWFEWEERPGPAPAGDQGDERVLKVCVVEPKGGPFTGTSGESRDAMRQLRLKT